MADPEKIADVVYLDDMYERLHAKSRRVAAAAIHEAQMSFEGNNVIEFPIKEEPEDIIA
jgi:hypothetical protein